MPPAAAKNFFVILFDLKVKSLAKSFQTLSKMLLYEQLSVSKDQFKLFAVNAAKTSNNLHHNGIYNINADAKLQTILEEIKNLEIGQSDWLKALEVGISELKEWYEKPGIITLKLVLISDLTNTNPSANSKLMEQIIYDVTEYDMFLYILGVDIEPPRMIATKQDIYEWMQNLQVDKVNENLQLAKKIVTHTPHSIICNHEMGAHLFISFSYEKGMQPWIVPLSFGSTITLPVSTIKFTDARLPFKLENSDKYSRDPDGAKWVYEDEKDKELHEYDIIKGMVLHGKFVHIETDGRFKIQQPRRFTVRGFTDIENVPEYFHQSDSSYLVLPDAEEYEYLNFFNILVQQMAEMRKCIIAERVYNANANQKMVVLLPRVDLNIKCFVMNELPFADDLRHKYVEQDVSKAPNIEENVQVTNFLDSLNVDGKMCKIKLPLAPTLQIDENSLSIIQKVVEKSVDEKLLLSKFDSTPVQSFNFFDSLKSEWPEREVESVKEEENQHMDDFSVVDDFDFS